MFAWLVAPWRQVSVEVKLIPKDNKELVGVTSKGGSSTNRAGILDEYGRDLVQLCDDVTEAIRTAEEPPAPPKEPLADLELLPPKLIERLAAAAGRGREL